MVNAEPLSVVDELSVVLPQRHRARVLKVRPYQNDAVLILLQDFIRVAPGRGRGSSFNGLEPRWRLFMYRISERSATELCTFKQPAGSPLRTVHMTSCREPVYVLFHTRLVRVDVASRTVDDVCQLKLPDGKDAVHELRAFASRESEVYFTMTSGEEDLLLYRVPLDDRPAAGAPFPGVRGERLAISPDGDLYAVDLLDVYRYTDGNLVRSVDLSESFEGWHKTPNELLTVASDGRILVGCGERLLVLTPGLEEVLGTYTLPCVPDDIVWVEGQGRLLLSKVDPVQCTLLVQSVVL